MTGSTWRIRAVAAGAAVLIAAALSGAHAQDTAPAATPPLGQAAPAPRPFERPPRPTLPFVRRFAAAPVLSAPATPAAAPGARLAPGAAIPPAELEAFVDGAVRQAMLNDHIPGAAISVVQNGQVLLKKGYGLASFSPRRPVDPDTTLFRLGPISAGFTWIAVLREVEKGRMRLDAPINIYLPEKLQVRDQGFAEPVKLRDLMDQASGFEERAFGRLYERKPDRVRSLEVYLRQERPRRVLAPGVRPEYSDYGVALGGEAASQVAGQPFEDLIESELLRPLGLNHTSFREPRSPASGLPTPMPAALAQDMAQGYLWTGAALQPRPFAFAGQIAPAAAASSTAADMARYMMLLLNGGALDGTTVYGPGAAQGLHTVLLRSAPGVDGWTEGLNQQRLPGGFDGFGASGGTLSFRANLVTAPALGLGVFVAANSESSGALTDRLPDLIVEHFYGGPRPAPQSPGDADALRQVYAGYYLSEQRRDGGIESFVDRLEHTAVVDADPRGLVAIRSPDGADVWTPDGPAGQFLSLADNRRSAFQIQDGQAVRWFAPGGGQSFVRVSWFMRRAGLETLAAIALLASLATLLGLFLRDRRDFRQTGGQRRAGALQTTASVLWLTAMAAFGVWSAGAQADEALAFFDWPGGFILFASACALVAAVASLGQVVLLPVVWRGGRRLDSWTTGRKLGFTATAAVFMTFSVMLALWGALEPWNS